ncbi:MAG TPA: nucleotide exchange factor GrpE [Vulgatibacter sp.]|nr:nucleotide exchange factor GrpE [Vulgatibacter sp.]
MPDPKGAFRADISDDAIQEALRAVEEREAGKAPEGDDPPVADGEEILVSVEADDDRIAALEAALAEKEQLLEESLARGRETMERLQELNEKVLRQAADFDNFRKRAAREKEEVQRFGIEKVLKELVPVLDNFDRALEHAKAGTDLESFSQGVAMTRRHFEEALGRFGVKGFTAVGEPFDPRFHEAMEQVESTEHPANVVVREMVRGYLLHDRLVRPALVSVSKGPGPAEAAGDPEAAPAEQEAAAGDPKGPAGDPEAPGGDPEPGAPHD